MARIIRTGNKEAGFTLIELLVVLLILSLLAGLASPIIGNSKQRANEAVLKEDLKVVREAIDLYYTNHGTYPETLDILKEKRYLRNIPADPVGEDGRWELVIDGETNGIIDIKTNSDKEAIDGSNYKNW